MPHGLMWVAWGVCFKNTYELLHLRTRKIFTVVWISHLSMYGKDILCGTHKISYPYIERCVLYSHVNLWQLFDLRAYKHLWNFPLDVYTHSICHEIWTKLDCFVNSLWPGDAIWRHVTRSTLVQIMACCLTAPSHYLNQCWLIIS